MATDNYYEFSTPQIEPDMGTGGLSWDEIEKKHRAFAIQYDYPGDDFILWTYANWPDVPYISGPESRPDGTEYELPAM